VCRRSIATSSLSAALVVPSMSSVSEKNSTTVLAYEMVSDGARAARSISVSGLTRDLIAVSVERIGAHHSAGTLSRCHHLDTADDLAPISAAIPSREGQSSIRARNELIESAMKWL